ncbi:follistatin-like [Mya arenaria]|uniref:follistatin-like n=1 Tax=Mya arenaria TaxID=6604 RepID=UPI0022E48E15|nr:follistatin-like [Mya arenaria]
MELPLLLLLAVVGYLTNGAAGNYEYDPDYLVPSKCRACDVKSCPQLTFCAGKMVKDHCGCCQRCSSALFQPHVPYRPDPPLAPTASPPTLPTQPGDVCEKRQCPKFKVCAINVQGLPICTCPSEYICRRRRANRNKRGKDEPTVCGTNGVTYESRCHLKIASCSSEKRIKRKHDGPCTAEDIDETKHAVMTETAPDVGEYFPDRDTAIQTTHVNESEKARLRKLKKKQKRKERKERKQRKREKKRRRKNNKDRDSKRKARSRRMKRRNEGFNTFPSNYEYLINRHTRWSTNQVRKSKI